MIRMARRAALAASLLLLAAVPLRAAETQTAVSPLKADQAE